MINRLQRYSAQISIVAALCIAPACSLHRIDTAPQPLTAVPEHFSVTDIHEDHPEFSGAWWESLDRPALNVLITQALSDNVDVAQAVASLKQARALTRQTTTFRLPQVNAEATLSDTTARDNIQRGSAGLDAVLSWELDIWGRVAASTQADRQEAQARHYDIDAVKLGVSADIAQAYFSAVAAHSRIDLLEQQLTLDRKLQDLLQLRFDNGIGTSVDVMRQKARVADSLTLIPTAEADIRVFEHRLDVLSGGAPDAVSRVPEDDTLTLTEAMPAIGVPAALLLNRPDVKAAQAELIAADADIAAAIADRLPRITLNSSYGISDSARYTGRVGALSAGFIQPLLDWGRRKAEVTRNKALYEERLAAYTQLFHEAAEDVENALIREEKQREFLARLNAQKNILRRVVRDSEERYTQGIDDYLPVIDALQELRNVERNIITEKLNLLTFRINLFRAIGGPMQPVTKDKDTSHEDS